MLGSPLPYIKPINVPTRSVPHMLRTNEKSAVGVALLRGSRPSNTVAPLARGGNMTSGRTEERNGA